MASSSRQSFCSQNGHVHSFSTVHNGWLEYDLSHLGMSRLLLGHFFCISLLVTKFSQAQNAGYVYIYIHIWSLDGISWYLHVNHSSILRDPLPPCLDTVLMIYGHLDLPKISAPPSDSAVIAEILRSRKSHPEKQQNMPERHGDVSSLQNNWDYIETTVAL